MSKVFKCEATGEVITMTREKNSHYDYVKRIIKMVNISLVIQQLHSQNMMKIN